MQYFLIFESMVKLTMKRFEKDCSENRCFSIFSCGCNHYKSVHIGFAKIQLFPHSTNFYFFFSVFLSSPNFYIKAPFLVFPFLFPVHHHSCAFPRRRPPLPSTTFLRIFAQVSPTRSFPDLAPEAHDPFRNIQ